MGELPADRFGNPPFGFSPTSFSPTSISPTSISPTKPLGSALSWLSPIQHGRCKVVSDLR